VRVEQPGQCVFDVIFPPGLVQNGNELRYTNWSVLTWNWTGRQAHRLRINSQRAGSGNEEKPDLLLVVEEDFLEPVWWHVSWRLRPGVCNNNNNNSICIAPLKIKFARGALQSKRTQKYKWAKPAISDEVNNYIKASVLKQHRLDRRFKNIKKTWEKWATFDLQELCQTIEQVTDGLRGDPTFLTRCSLPRLSSTVAEMHWHRGTSGQEWKVLRLSPHCTSEFIQLDEHATTTLKKGVHYIITIKDYATIFSANNFTCVYYTVNAHSNFAVIQNKKFITLFLALSSTIRITQLSSTDNIICGDCIHDKVTHARFLWNLWNWLYASLFAGCLFHGALSLRCPSCTVNPWSHIARFLWWNILLHRAKHCEIIRRHGK
jgi:hypothetical protein